MILVWVGVGYAYSFVCCLVVCFGFAGLRTCVRVFMLVDGSDEGFGLLFGWLVCLMFVTWFWYCCLL